MLCAEVVDEACQSCNRCSARRVCKTGALLLFDPGEAAVVDQSRCRGCGTCVAACPYAAIVMRSAVAVGSIPSLG